MTIPQPPAAGPDPGQPGHFAHHEWLEQSVVALDALSERVLGGSVVVTANNSATSATVAVTFPPGTFVANPAVTAQVYGSGFWIAAVSGLTANGVSFYATTKDSVARTATLTVFWIAVAVDGGTVLLTESDEPEDAPANHEGTEA